MISPGHLLPPCPQLRLDETNREVQLRANGTQVFLCRFEISEGCLSGSNWTPLFHANSPFCIRKCSRPQDNASKATMTTRFVALQAPDMDMLG